MANNELIQCFLDSVNISNNILKAETRNAIFSNRVYKENFISQNRIIRNKNHFDVFDYIIIEATTSFNAAKQYLQYGKTAVLNFANPHNPGGGVNNGATAQEECLCRSSNLYPCISDKNVYNEYYLYNKNIPNNFFSDRLIYTKDVTVFKDDSNVPHLMPETDWFKVDVITCAAPYIAKRKYTNRTALKELFKGRIKNIFEAAIDNGVEVIILGAFGCGAFKNPPEVVAKAFHEVIKENDYASFFKKIVFAIKSNYSNNCNYETFDQEFFADYMQIVLKMPELPLIEPLRSICDDFKILSDYENWKTKNKYYGKQFSILGDSISTLAGYNPKGYNVFYYGESSERANVKEMENTWWGKVIDFFGGELLVNNSWSGSRVTRLPDNKVLFPSGCSNERTCSLHINNIKPDVIIIYLGTNDWAFGANTSYVDNISDDDFHCNSFDFAYSQMLSKIRTNYPNAEVWCCTLNTTFMSSNSSFEFPYAFGGTHIEEYNEIIKDAANMHKCKVIDLYDYHIPFDSIDGSHPNAKGMNTLATIMIREIGGKETDRFLDCENEQHEFGLTYGYDQNYNGGYKICKKCGKIDFQSDYYDEFYDFEPPSKCSKCQGEFEMTGQNGSYDYYTCKDCGNCICVSPFSILSTQEDVVMIEETYDSHAEYVRLPSDITRVLFGDTIKLYDSDANNNIEIQKVKFDVGRSADCELQIENNYISQIHASFYHEDSCWFIMDKGSTNGTWLNGRKLEQNTKYELYCDDIISFSKVKEYTFYKTNTDYNKKYSEEQLLKILEEALEKYHENTNDTDALKVIALTMAEVPLYFPMDFDVSKMFAGVDPLQLKKGDTVTTQEDIKMKILTLQVGDEEIVPMFTSAEQAHKGPDVNIVRLHPQNYLPLVISMNKDFAVNPFGKHAISLKCGFLSDIVLPLVQDSLKSNEDKSDKRSNESNTYIDEDIPRVINGRYELLRLIGEGAMTKVYLATDKAVSKVRAVKITKTNALNNSDFVREAVLKEAETVKLFNHPAIPKVIDIIVDSQYVAIVQDYVEGETLKDIVEKYAPQPVERVVNWAMQVCDILSYLHSFNPPYIHRDIKPANLMLEPNGTIKLIDFGIMRTYNPNKTRDTCFLGTRGYAAPEQFGGCGQTDIRTDVYGLGMTMYHLLTGLDPKSEAFFIAPLCQVNPHLPKGLEYVVNKCTQLDPVDRYQSCAELKNDLNNYQNLPPKQNLFSKLFNK